MLMLMVKLCLPLFPQAEGDRCSTTSSLVRVAIRVHVANLADQELILGTIAFPSNLTECSNALPASPSKTSHIVNSHPA